MASAHFRQIQALAWELCQPHKYLFLSIGGLLLTGLLVNIADDFSLLPDGDVDSTAEALQESLFVLAVFIGMQIFSYTEFNSRRERKGFPQRLFSLPINSLTLVAIPLILGLVAIETILIASYSIGITGDALDAPVWGGFKLGVFMLTYQMILWGIPALGSFRLIVIGIVGFFLIVLEQTLLAATLLAMWAITTVLGSWKVVASQRSGGATRNWRFATLADRLLDALPRRKTSFASAKSACFWYEWRQAGFLLPLTVGILLITIIGPVSVLVSDNARNTRTILSGLLLIPLVLASVVGKAFSKADLLSPDMAMPAFLAVKPISNGEIILAKMKVAALSTLVTWGLVLGFACAWINFWANPEQLYAYGNFVWALQNHSMLAQYATAALVIMACVLLTWRFLVAGLWIGLSRHRTWFTYYCVALAVVLMLGPNYYFELRDWVSGDYGRLHVVVWTAGILVIAKFWLAAWSWRAASTQLSLRYLRIWFVGTGCMLTLAMLLADSVILLVGTDNYQMQALLVFLALLVMPLVQVGLAPASLANNRHR